MSVWTTLSIAQFGGIGNKRQPVVVSARRQSRYFYECGYENG
ncbi:MAG: hypothetical protein ACK48A_11415 [Pseudanabaena sp.]